MHHHAWLMLEISRDKLHVVRWHCRMQVRLSVRQVSSVERMSIEMLRLHLKSLNHAHIIPPVYAVHTTCRGLGGVRSWGE